MTISAEQIALGALGTILTGVLGWLGVDIFKRLRELETANAKAEKSRAVMHLDMDHIKDWQDKFDIKFTQHIEREENMMGQVLSKLDSM